MDSRVQLHSLHDRLISWLCQAAFPLWTGQGIDPDNGGFIEAIGQNGLALPHPRRARVQARQIYSLAQAPELGWARDIRPLVLRGTRYFTAHYQRPDGLFRTLAGIEGSALDDRAMLYDQAFVLLSYAAAAIALDAVPDFESRALDLRRAIESAFRAGDGAFHSDESQKGVFESNPHMHLLECCLAWAEIGADPGWASWAQDLVELAMRRFIHPESGALGEFFGADWRPAPGIAGRIVEPGHQFEWAWLLLRSEFRHPRLVREAALRLIDIGENHGVHNQVAVNALLDDLSIHDGNARFWPQTERLKAALFAARLTGEDRYWSTAAKAAASLFPYLDTPVAGLWLDVQLPTGKFVDAVSPASSFYHLVGAIVALHAVLETMEGTRS